MIRSKWIIGLGLGVLAGLVGCDDDIPHHYIHETVYAHHAKLLSWEHPYIIGHVYPPTTYWRDVSLEWENDDTLSATPTPEPLTAALCGLGLVVLVLRIRRQP